MSVVQPEANLKGLSIDAAMRRRDLLKQGCCAVGATVAPGERLAKLHRTASNGGVKHSYPDLRTSRDSDKPDQIRSVFHFAVGDLYSNVRDYKNGLLKTDHPCLCAGADYRDPWTRDAAINTWNGFGLLFPEVAKATLLSCVEESERGYQITGQYWDKIIWGLGGWHLYLYTGDREFLALAFEATRNTLRELEAAEYDSGLGLFRGAAVYGDGVSAYPALYTQTGTYNGGEWVSAITKWVSENPSLRARQGFGLPMHALSTNCLYRAVYLTLKEMAHELKVAPNPFWSSKAQNLSAAINREFWDAERNSYRYMVDPNGNSDRQEGLGLAFALLFDVASSAQRSAIYQNTYISRAGIPCLYPSFERYVNPAGTSYGRHSGTVWPHVEAFWGQAAARDRQLDIFGDELNKLTEHVWRDKQFVEIYHPDTGLPYGGIQESNTEPFWQEWPVGNRQSWSASGYIRLILMGLVGARFDTGGIHFLPCVPLQSGWLQLKGLAYREATLDIEISGQGHRVVEFRINGMVRREPLLPSVARGHHRIQIEVSST